MKIRPALKGRNKILDHKPVLPLQGVAILNTRSDSQGGALGWHVAAPTFQAYVRPPHSKPKEIADKPKYRPKKAVGPMFRKADPDHMLSRGTTYVRIFGARFKKRNFKTGFWG
jgi:hypothetical protein